jgi:hypothetical protein
MLSKVAALLLLNEFGTLLCTRTPPSFSTQDPVSSLGTQILCSQNLYSPLQDPLRGPVSLENNADSIEKTELPSRPIPTELPRPAQNPAPYVPQEESASHALPKEDVQASKGAELPSSPISTEHPQLPELLRSAQIPAPYVPQEESASHALPKEDVQASKGVESALEPRPLKFLKTTVPDDGNCFFHCLAHHSNSSAAELREWIVLFLDSLNPQLDSVVIQAIHAEVYDIALDLKEKINQLKETIGFLTSLKERLPPLKDSLDHIKEFQAFETLLGLKQAQGEKDLAYLQRYSDQITQFCDSFFQSDSLSPALLQSYRQLVTNERFHVGKGVIEIMSRILDAQILVHSWDEREQSYVSSDEASSAFKGNSQIHLEKVGNHFNYLELAH